MFSRDFSSKFPKFILTVYTTYKKVAGLQGEYNDAN